MGEDLGFGCEVAGFYHRYRRGYPSAVIDRLIGAFSLTSADVVIDLGCGTGQLTVPIARRVRAVAGVGPEPDMLARDRQAAAEQADTMTEAGLDVTETRYDYTADLDHLVGGVYSALAAQRLPPPDQRTAFADQIHRAVSPHHSWSTSPSECCSDGQVRPAITNNASSPETGSRCRSGRLFVARGLPTRIHGLPGLGLRWISRVSDR